MNNPCVEIKLPTLVVWDELWDELKAMNTKDVFIHEQRKGEYILLDETNPEQHPVRTWHMTFEDGRLQSVHLKTRKYKSRRFGKHNLSKCLRAYLLLLGYNTY